MASTQLSNSSYLPLAATVIGTAPLSLGLNALFRPRSALSLLEFSPPASEADKKLVDSLMMMYGARDVFMGLAVYSAAYFENRKALGWIMVAGGAVVAVDGVVSRRQIGWGEWNHWGFTPVLAGVGGALLGILDGL